jgi:hypothetical protein
MRLPRLGNAERSLPSFARNLPRIRIVQSVISGGERLFPWLEVLMLAHSRLLWIPLYLLALGACATTGGGGVVGGSVMGVDRDGNLRVDQNVITAEELEMRVPGLSAYEAIERLRPTWLDQGTNSRAPAFADNTLPKLLVDEKPFPIDRLNSLRTTDIEIMLFTDARDATTVCCRSTAAASWNRASIGRPHRARAREEGAVAIALNASERAA